MNYVAILALLALLLNYNLTAAIRHNSHVTGVSSKNFSVIARFDAIRILDRTAKKTVYVTPPDWLKNGGICIKPLITIAPDERFFVVAGHRQYNQYALKHELWKLGTSTNTYSLEGELKAQFAGVTIEGPRSEPAIYEIEFTSANPTENSIVMLDELNPGFSTRSMVSITLTENGVAMPEGLLSPESSTPSMAIFALIHYAKRARRGISASKYIAAKTGMHPLATHKAHPYDRHYAKLYEFRKSIASTNLNPKIVNLVNQHIAAHKKPDDVAIARAVFNTIYQPA